MTGPVLAFDASATRGGKLTLARVAPAKSKPQPQVDVIAAFGGLLGVTLLRSDLQEALPDPVNASDVVECLQAAGLKADLVKANLNKVLWPALAVMNASELVLVLESDSAQVTVFDPKSTDKRREIDVSHFDAMFTGQIITAEVSSDDLTARHAASGKKAHWFWGEVSKFRRIIGEVALGSFVANMLAVAVALFSLQVYDRVIPHQSTSTLWVLAIGAGLAMLLEAFLRIARARLMDGAGRRIEMRVQTILMDRVLGMQSGQGQTPSQTFAAVREFSSIREFFTASTIGTLTDLPFIVLFLALVASIGGNVVWVLFIAKRSTTPTRSKRNVAKTAFVVCGTN